MSDNVLFLILGILAFVCFVLFWLNKFFEKLLPEALPKITKTSRFY